MKLIVNIEAHMDLGEEEAKIYKENFQGTNFEQELKKELEFLLDTLKIDNIKVEEDRNIKKLRPNIFKVLSNGEETDLDVEQVQELINERDYLLSEVDIYKKIIRNHKLTPSRLEERRNNNDDG